MGRQHFFLRDQPVIAAIDIFHLRGDLLLRADQERLLTLIVGMSRNDHALLVKHLQDWEFREFTKLAVLERGVGEQNGVRSGLKAYAVLFRGDD